MPKVSMQSQTCSSYSRQHEGGCARGVAGSSVSDVAKETREGSLAGWFDSRVSTDVISEGSQQPL